MLEVNQLSVQLGGRSVLQEVNLKLDQGQFMGLIGPMGRQNHAAAGHPRACAQHRHYHLARPAH